MEIVGRKSLEVKTLNIYTRTFLLMWQYLKVRIGIAREKMYLLLTEEI